MAAAVCTPRSPEEVAAVLAVANDAGVPVTTAGGRSGVCGASVPVHGGIVLDMTAMQGIVALDDTSLIVDVRAGTFGHELEAELRADHELTLGHWPQSIELSTVGGWLACRSAGQYSTRYGKIEDIVVGLDVALGRRAHDLYRRLPPSGGGARSDAAVRRQRGDARGHHRRPPAGPAEATARAPGRLRAPLLRRRRRALPAHPATRRHSRGAPAVRRGRVGPHASHRGHERRARARRSRRAAGRGDDGRRRRGGEGGRAARRGVGRSVARAPQRRQRA